MIRYASSLVLAALLLASCGESKFAEPVPSPDPAPVAEADAQNVLLEGRQLVRTAEVEIEVADLQRVRIDLETVVRKHGGYVEFVQAGGRVSSWPSRFVVRVPAATLDAVLAEVRALAVEVVSEIVAVEDVTAQSVDLDARRATLAATETELTALLKDVREGEKTAASIMSVFRELTEIRSRIETLDAQRKALAEKVSLARVEITARLDSSADALASRWAPLAFAADCLEILVQILQFVGYALIFLLVVGLPLLLLVWLPLRWIRRLRRRARTRASAGSLPPPLG